MTIFFQRYKSPIGRLYLVADDTALCGVLYEKNWSSYRKKCAQLEERDTAILRQAKKQLAEYFIGKRRSFDIPFRVSGTAFQNQVWAELTRTPFRQTRTHKQQATKLRSPRATRAVGRTNGLKPLSILVPCHSVVGSNGSLTGYAGGLAAIARQKSRNSGR